jgi:hypothetical protein
MCIGTWLLGCLCVCVSVSVPPLAVPEGGYCVCICVCLSMPLCICICICFGICTLVLITPHRTALQIPGCRNRIPLCTYRQSCEACYLAPFRSDPTHSSPLQLTPVAIRHSPGLPTLSPIRAASESVARPLPEWAVCLRTYPFHVPTRPHCISACYHDSTNMFPARKTGFRALHI